MTPDISDYFGYGSNKLPIHRSDTTTCPCKGCQKTRGVMSGLQAVGETFRFIVYLDYMRWITRRDRKHWPDVNRVDPEKLDNVPT